MEGDLSRAWKRLKKKRGWDDHVGIVAEMKELMVRCAPLPKAMAEEVAEFFLPPLLDEEAVYKSEEVLELLSGGWTPESSILTGDDWNFLREQVNAWALEMEMSVVTEIMRAVVNEGGFSDNDDSR